MLGPALSGVGRAWSCSELIWSKKVRVVEMDSKSATAATYLCGVKSIVSIDVLWVAPIATIVLGAIETIVPNGVV